LKLNGALFLNRGLLNRNHLPFHLSEFGGCLRTRVKVYIAEQNRPYPTKYAKFGDSPLVSLDEVLFDDGTATRGDTVSRGLWD
jgi:hypothetical protein